MLGKQQYILSILKQIPFLLVFCGLLSQPIVKTYSLLSDTSYEIVDYDFDDDTEKKEAEDAPEEDKKVTPYSINFLLTETDLSLYNSHFYVQKSCISQSLEILIPPPELA